MKFAISNIKQDSYASMIFKHFYRDFCKVIPALFNEKKNIFTYSDHYFTKFMVLKLVKSPQAIDLYEPC